MEFADRTITGLFAIPVGRATIAVSIVLTAATLLGGLTLALGTFTPKGWDALGRLSVEAAEWPQQIAKGKPTAAV